MKMIICFAALIAVALAAPASPPAEDVQILRYANDNIGVEGYKYAFETSDGTVREEQGVLENVGTDDEGIAVKGSFTYTGPDSVVYTVTYTADKNGFVPSGSHIPTA